MSFVKTLATLAVGFAAAKGVEKFRQAGGVTGMKDALRGASTGQNGMADQMGAMADKYGVPGGADAVRDMFAKFSGTALQATEATEAGLGSMMAAMTGAAATGAKSVSDMMGAVTAGTPVNAMMEENAKLMIRAMIQAAKADGEIDAEERAKILDHLSDASDEEMAFVQAELNAPLDAAALAASVGDASKAQVYSAALMAITVDTEAERTYLKALARGLMLDDASVAQIHKTMGKPAL